MSYLKLLSVSLFSFLSILLLFNSCSYSSKTCTSLLNESAHQKYDVIVVPGVPLENEKWSLIMKARVYWSKYLYDKGIAKNIMYSGSSVYTPYVEAEIMALYAQALGIPKEHIYTETKAEHSTENIYYSYKKAKRLNFQSIALATDPVQAKQLRRFIKNRINSDVRIIPIVFDTLRAMQGSMADPKIEIEKAYVKDFVSLPERESFFKRFKGTLGLNIKEDLYE